jgi:hypothetical protein
MLIKVKADIIIDVQDAEQAEEACGALDSGLDNAITAANFPYGEVIDADVNNYEKVTKREAEEKGWVE